MELKVKIQSYHSLDKAKTNNPGLNLLCDIIQGRRFKQAIAFGIENVKLYRVFQIFQSYEELNHINTPPQT